MTTHTIPAESRTASITPAQRERARAYLTRTISNYEHDRETTDTATETGLAHAAVLDMTIASWRRRLDALAAA